MKNIVLFILSILLLQAVNAQIPWRCAHTVNENSDPSAVTTASAVYVPNGGCFTPKGTIRVLIIFARFTNDAGQELAGWSPDKEAPDYVDAVTGNAPQLLFSSTRDFLPHSTVRSVSNYYKTFSNGKFTFLGDVLKKNGKPYAIRVTPQGNEGGWQEINKKILDQMKTEFPNFDWSPYDLHTNQPNYAIDASLTGPDNQPDYVIILYRYSPDWAIQPVQGMNTLNSWNESYGGFSTILRTDSSYVYNNNYTLSTGYTQCAQSDSLEQAKITMLHEIAHELYSCPHHMGANHEAGNFWRFPTAGWGMMTNLETALNTSANAWERWLLDWSELKTSVSQVNSDIQSTADLQNNGVYTLRDFVTTSDALRIKLPHKKNTYLWIENHQQLSIFDYKPLGNVSGGCLGLPTDTVADISKGIYMFVENIGASREATPVKHSNSLHALNAQGNFDYSHSPTALPKLWNYMCNNDVYTFQRKEENPICGIHPYLMLPDDYPIIAQQPGSNGSISFPPYYGNSLEAQAINRETDGTTTAMTYAAFGGVNYAAKQHFNRRSDAFLPGDEISLSGMVPVVMAPDYSAANYYQGSYILNGISVKILSLNSDKSITLQIRYDDYTLRNNKRWCGFIDLMDNTNDTNPDLLLAEGVRLRIDKTGNANRHAKHSFFNDFINPSVFSVRKNACMQLEKNATLLVENVSSLVLDSGSVLRIKDSAKVIIKKGSTFLVRPTARIEIEGSGRIDVEDEAYACMGTNVAIVLQNNLSTIEFHSGYTQGINKNAFSPSFVRRAGACIDLSQVHFTGNGSIILGTSGTDLYIQNELFTTNQQRTGRNIYAGSVIEPLLHSGPVIIKSGTNVIFKATKEVQLHGGFQVEAGAVFTIEKPD